MVLVSCSDEVYCPAILLTDLHDGLRELVTELGARAKAASRVMGVAVTEKKNDALRRVAAEFRSSAAQSILEANLADVADARQVGMSSALIDRLTLDRPRLDAVAAMTEVVAGLADPVGRVSDGRTLASGLRVARMRVPLGVVAMIYEARPNATVEAAALCVKSGNAVLLRGGHEALRTNARLAVVFARALSGAGLPADAVLLVATPDREAVRAIVELEGSVDLVIPRGGDELVRFVRSHARMPVLSHGRGVCHVYVDADADFDVAERVALNSKTQRPGVCNAMETLLVDEKCAPGFVPRIVAAMRVEGVEVRGDGRVRELVADVKHATTEDWDAEYLDRILSVALVAGLEGALAHVARHGTRHTEAIVTRDQARAQRWLREVDASLVLVNASTRFNDGGELGLGAEIGISTTKLHAYGPMGLEQLCTQKWIAEGTGQVRA